MLLALDVSSVCTGYAVFHDKNLIAYGKYRKEEKTHDERLFSFEQWLGELLLEYNPDERIVEDIYSAGRAEPYGTLKMYQTVVLLAHIRHFGVPMPSRNRMQPAGVKRILHAKYGNDHENRKRMMVNMINTLYGLDLRYKDPDKTKRVSDDDIADAIAVGRAWLITYGDLAAA